MCLQIWVLYLGAQKALWQVQGTVNTALNIRTWDLMDSVVLEDSMETGKCCHVYCLMGWFIQFLESKIGLCNYQARP